MTPRDTWDPDNAAQITIADLIIDVKMRHVAMQSSNYGLFYGRGVKAGAASPFGAPAAAAPISAHQGG